MFSRRPKANETEDDILRFQQEFLASGSKPSATVIKKRAAPSPEVRDVVRDVVEMDCDDVEETMYKRSRFQEEKTERMLFVSL